MKEKGYGFLNIPPQHPGTSKNEVPHFLFKMAVNDFFIQTHK